MAFAAASLLVVTAQEAAAQPFPEGVALNPIEPAPAGDRFFLAPDGSTDPALPEEDDFPLRAQVFSHLTLSPPLRRTTAAGTEDIVERQLYIHAGLAYLPTSWLLLHADLPIAALQEGQGPDAPSSAVGDLRLGARFGVLGDRNSPFALGPAVDVWLPTGSQENVTSDGTVRVEPKLVMSGKASVFVYALNGGFRFRKHYDPGSTEIGNSLAFGAAAGVSLFDDVLQIAPEIQGTALVDSRQTPSLAFDGRTSPIDALFGAKVQLGDFVLGAGYGVPITTAPGNASRVFLSFGFVPAAHVEGKVSATLHTDRDGDGIFDNEDACPDKPGPDTGSPETRGCPQDDFQDVDSDGDEILDSADACPDKMGAPSDDPAKNGCPQQAPPPAPVAAGTVIPASPSDRDGDTVADPDDFCPDEKGIAQPKAGTQLGCPVGKKPAAVAAKPKGPVATFVGFRELDPKSVLVFVELTEQVDVEPVVKGRVLEYRMKGTQVTLRNNRNPLLASSFDSVVESAQLVPDGKSIKLVIKLRRDADARALVERHTDGATLRIELTEKPKTETPAKQPEPAAPAKKP